MLLLASLQTPRRGEGAGRTQECPGSGRAGEQGSALSGPYSRAASCWCSSPIRARWGYRKDLRGQTQFQLPQLSQTGPCREGNAVLGSSHCPWPCPAPLPCFGAPALCADCHRAVTSGAADPGCSSDLRAAPSSCCPQSGIFHPVWRKPIHALSRDNDFISHLRRGGCWVVNQQSRHTLSMSGAHFYTFEATEVSISL